MNRRKRTLSTVVLALAVSLIMAAQAQTDAFLQRYDLAMENLDIAVVSVPDDSAKATDELDQAVNALLSLSRDTTSPSLVSSMERLFDRARTAVQNRSTADIAVQTAVLAGGFRRLVFESAFVAAAAGDLTMAEARLGHLATDMGMPQEVLDSLNAATDATGLRLGFEGGIAKVVQNAVATARAEIGSDRAAAYLASGNHKDDDFKTYLKNFCLGMTQLGSIEYYEEQLQQFVKKHDTKGIENTIAKLKKSPLTHATQRIIAYGYRALNKFDLFERALQKLLALNRQDLWAANELGKLYMKSGQIAKGVEILERLSHFHSTNSERFLTLGTAYINAGMDQQAEKSFLVGNELTGGEDKRFQDGLAKVEISKGNVDSALAMVGARGFSEEVISYLNMKAIICLRKDLFDDAIGYYEQALQGAQLNFFKAKIYFNLGLAYARQGILGKSKTYLNESLRLGDGKFKRAEGPLKIIHKIEKSMECAQVESEDLLMDDLEFELIS